MNFTISTDETQYQLNLKKAILTAVDLSKEEYRMYLKKNYETVVVFVRGDMEVNEIKVQNYLKEEIIPDDGSTDTGIVYGFTGPVGLDIKKGTILIDNSLKGMNNMVCGANKEDYHYINVNLERDMKKPFEYNDFSKAYQGSICPCCGKKTINI